MHCVIPMHLQHTLLCPSCDFWAGGGKNILERGRHLGNGIWP